MENQITNSSLTYHQVLSTLPIVAYTSNLLRQMLDSWRCDHIVSIQDQLDYSQCRTKTKNGIEVNHQNIYRCHSCL